MRVWVWSLGIERQAGRRAAVEVLSVMAGRMSDAPACVAVQAPLGCPISGVGRERMRSVCEAVRMRER